MLEFDLSTIIWTVVNLLILYFFFRKFLFGRVNAVREKRAALVASSIHQSEEAAQQAQQLKAQYEQQINVASQEAQQIVSGAKARAEQAYAARLAAADQDAKQMKKEAEAQIAAQREHMLQGVRQEVSKLAVMAAAKVAQKALDESTDLAVAEAFLKEAGDPS